MTVYSKDLLAALEPALRAARRVLADMEDDEIPAQLRKVAQSSARSLPPPLQRSLVAHIDTDDAFRSKVTAEAGDGLTDAATTFLERGTGWWASVVDDVAARTASHASDEVAQARQEVSRLERFVAEAKARAEAARAEADEERRTAKDRVAEARERVRELATAGKAASSEESDRLDALEEALAGRSKEEAELRGVIDALRQRIRRLRKSRPSEQSGRAGSLPTDPVARARALDHQHEVATRGVRAAAEPRQAEPVAAFALPAGVRPDGEDALEWLLAAPRATVIVDGYNLLFRLAGDRPPSGQARTRLESALRNLHRRSASRHAVIVVYDSTLGGDRSPTTAGGLEVRFAARDRLADEEITALAAGMSGPVVVVSSDREVREGAAHPGVVALWSEALVPMVSGT